MKKFAAAALALVMVLLCFSGCANNKKTFYTVKDKFEMKLYPNGETVASGLTAVQIIETPPMSKQARAKLLSIKHLTMSLW